MGVTPAELEANNGKFVEIVYFTDVIYKGILNYEPLDSFSIQLYNNSCCSITFMSPDDVNALIPQTTLLIDQDLRQLSFALLDLNLAIGMKISGRNQICNCLFNKVYNLEWSDDKQKYECDYFGTCNYYVFHAELYYSEGVWVCYLALQNDLNLTCADGIHLDFPIDSATMQGSAQIEFTSTTTCACGPCNNDILTVSFNSER